MQKLVPCWFRMKEPKCPANVWTGEWALWSRDSFSFHVGQHHAPARCPFNGKRIEDSKPILKD